MIPQGQLRTKVRFKPCGKCSQIQHATIRASTTNQNLGRFLVNSVVYLKKKTQQDPLDSSDFVFYLWKSPFSCVILWEAG